MFGCGIASANDYDLRHGPAAAARLVVHYTLDDGRTGDVGAATTRLVN